MVTTLEIKIFKCIRKTHTLNFTHSTIIKTEKMTRQLWCDLSNKSKTNQRKVVAIILSEDNGKEDAIAYQSNEGFNSFCPQIFATFAAAIGAFSMGSVEAWTSPALPKMSNELGHLTSVELSRIASFSLLGAIASGFPAGFLIDKIGRKLLMMLITLPFVVGWLLITFADNLAMMYSGRLLSGFCAGCVSLVVPIFISEIAQDNKRGMLGSSFQLMATIGNLFVYVVGSYVSWEFLAFVCCIAPLISFFLLIFVHQSPIYLLSRDKVQEAQKSLMWYRGAKILHDVDTEFQSMQTRVEQSKRQGLNFKLFKEPHIWKPLLITFGLMTFQQLSGIEAIIMYTVDIFKKADSTLDLDLSEYNTKTIIIGALQVTATLVACFVIDKAGRKLLLIISGLVMAGSLISLGLFFYWKTNGIRDIQWLPIVSLATFMISYSIGFGPVCFVLVPELLPPKIIGIGSALAITVNWTLAYIVTRFFIPLSDLIELHWTFGLFAGLCLVATLFVYIFVPETRGKSMDEIQKHFKKID